MAATPGQKQGKVGQEMGNVGEEIGAGGVHSVPWGAIPEHLVACPE